MSRLHPLIELGLIVLALSGCDPSAESTPAPHAGAPMIATQEAGASRAGDQPDGVSLAELMDHVPRDAREATAPDGGTLVGSDSGVPGEEPPVSPTASVRRRMRGGRLDVQPLLSNPAIERAAREQIYWPLRQCKAKSGELPPPESIELSFVLRPDGTVDPTTVSAKATDSELDEVVECVMRIFSATPFRGPAAVRGTSARVLIFWPSVD